MLITVILLRGIPVRAFTNSVDALEYIKRMVISGENISDYTFDTIQLDGE